MPTTKKQVVKTPKSAFSTVAANSKPAEKNKPNSNFLGSDGRLYYIGVGGMVFRADGPEF